MNEQALKLVRRLQDERGTYGRIAQIAKASGVTARTLYKLMANEHAPSITTIDKLATYFRKEDRRAKQ